ncbi:MAG: DUF1800 domain-containing protein [Gemmatimonadaceae bacterium]
MPRNAWYWACAYLAAAPSVALAQRSKTHPTVPASAVVAGPTVREQTADQQAMQVLNRLAFGPRPGEAADVRKIGVDRWTEQQLQPEHINDAPMDQLIARYPMLAQSQPELAAQYAVAQKERREIKREKADTTGQAAAPVAGNVDVAALKQIQKQRVQLVGELSSARIARAVASNRQLLEVMTDFWENHFNVYARKNAIEPYYLADYDRTIREHAFGKFRDLLGAVAHSPAMLVYLDNAQSRANPGQPTLPAQRAQGFMARGERGGRGLDVEEVIRRRNLNSQQATQLRQFAANAKKNGGLNENYGRELLELHTLGVDGGYSQQDVIEAARALTGWSVRFPAQGGGFVFRPEWHDAAAKTFMGHQLPAGRGEADGEQILDIVARSPATAHFIALRLAQRFVSDSPSTALVNRAAQRFLSTDGDLREVVRIIVTSPEFFAATAYHSKVKSPFEVAVSAARALGAQADTTPITAIAVAYLGEPIFGHQAPDGWPETGGSWMNTGAILNRINFGMAVAANRLPGASFQNLPGADSLMAAPRTQQVDAVVASILGGAVSPDTRKILVSGDHPLAQSAAQQAAEQQTAASTANAAGASDMAATSAPTSMTDMNANAGADGMAPRVKGAGKQGLNLGIRGAGRNGIVGAPPQLTGLAQVVGLALGSPEFQRR